MRNMEGYEVVYNVKDLILYALSLGMGSHSDDSNELKFLYEKHEKFAGVPTFFLAFNYWARKKRSPIETYATTQGIPPFPPPIMVEAEIIPRRFLRKNTDISNLPIIHTWQSIVWHQQMKVPKQHVNQALTHNINLETISVLPKSIGTFVTSQSEVRAHDNNGQLLCTMQSSYLVSGINKKHVTAFDAGIPLITNMPKISSQFKQTQKKNPVFQWTYQTTPSQALLYRMTSGDSNHIHVDASVPDKLQNDKNAPLLHGLFTLALVFRAIMKFLDNNDDAELFFRKLEGAFVAPAFVGDRLCVRIWNEDISATTMETSNTKRFLFVIINHTTGVKLVDKGCIEVETISKSLLSTKRSRL